MEIIVFVDKDGTQEGNCDFKAFNVHGDDEQNIFVIIGHSMAMGTAEKVRVLNIKEYDELQSKADQWDLYQKWLVSKRFFDTYKDKFEEKER